MKLVILTLLVFNLMLTTLIVKPYFKTNISYFSFYLFQFFALYVVPSFFYFESYEVIILLNVYVLSITFGVVLYYIIPKKNNLELTSFTNNRPISLRVLIYLYFIFCSVFFISIKGMPPPALSNIFDFVRGEYMQENSKILRIVKYFIPYLTILIFISLEKRDVSTNNKFIFYCVFAISCFFCLYEGSKSSVFALVLTIFFYYKTFKIKSKYLPLRTIMVISVASILFFIVVFVNNDMISFLKYRLYSNNLDGLKLSVLNYPEEYGFLYGLGVITPVGIFLSKIFNFYFPTEFSTPGNLMAKYQGGILGYEEYNYELLNTLLGDAYLDFGILGVILYTLIVTYFIMLFFIKARNCNTDNERVVFYFLMITSVQILFIGKVGSYITSNIISYLFIYVVVRVFCFGIKSNKVRET